MPHDKLITHRLKAAHQSAGLTQQQLAMHIGLEPDTASVRMNQYERGKHAPDYPTTQRIALELGSPVAYFYCDGDRQAEILRLIAKMPINQQQALLEQQFRG